MEVIGVYLPLNTESMVAPQGQKIVLHIDDDEEDRQLVKESLCERDPDIRVQGFENGKAALLFLRRAKECAALPGLIILDLNMPLMNGREFLQKLKGDPELSAIPIVIFTTSSEPVDQAFAREHGVEFITKPPTLKQLTQTVARLLYLFSIGYALIRVNLLCYTGRH